MHALIELSTSGQETVVTISIIFRSRFKKQGRIHGYLSRVRVVRASEKKSKCDGPTDRPIDRRTERVVESRARDQKVKPEA